jgi:hypothetical protein
MDIASAYPNSALPAWELVILAVVVAGSLALWLIVVFRADKSSARERGQAAGHLGVAVPDETAEDKLSAAEHAAVDQRHGAAA